jgi:hypothetical protein
VTIKTGKLISKIDCMKKYNLGLSTVKEEK